MRICWQHVRRFSCLLRLAGALDGRGNSLFGEEDEKNKKMLEDVHSPRRVDEMACGFMHTIFDSREVWVVNYRWEGIG